MTGENPACVKQHNFVLLEPVITWSGFNLLLKAPIKSNFGASLVSGNTMCVKQGVLDTYSKLCTYLDHFAGFYGIIANGRKVCSTF